MRIGIGHVTLSDSLSDKVALLEKFGHQVFIVGSDPHWISLEAETTPATPVVCVSCSKTVAQSWRDECPYCDGPVRPESSPALKAPPSELHAAFRVGDYDVGPLQELCTVCGRNWVDVSSGFDTCEGCRRRA